MARVFQALGISAAGLYIFLYVGLLWAHVGNGIEHLAVVFVATPIVCLILFFASFFLIGIRKREIYSNRPLPQAARPSQPPMQSKSTPTSMGFNLIRVVTSIVLSLAVGCGSFVLIGSALQKHFDNGSWPPLPLGAMLAWVVAPVFAIVGFLLVYYVMGVLRPKAETIGLGL